ncbi:diacylglycerol kinase family protein [Nocardia sp. NPDC004168]|uniref:diacylglycerol/lipid kinase family protein n=1 Tax=Nocardia sp. NPDC004168 TaxID=3154452 RepID=UPI0033BE8717
MAGAERRSAQPPMAGQWWARAAFAAVIAAAVLPLAVAGLLGLLTLLIAVTGGVAVGVAGIYWSLVNRGAVRVASAALAILAPVAVALLFVRERQLWVVLVSGALVAVAVACARRALRNDPGESRLPEFPAAPAQHPFLVMNPRSGGGKVVEFELPRKARELGAEVALLSGSHPIDVAALARRAVQGGADLLGVAGGDGTQASVAAVAAEHRLPFVVIGAGTRNHFARDLGLDTKNPAAGLAALRDGVEILVDLGTVNGRTFVNASFGVYAEVVRSPQYRDDKTGTVLRLLPDLLGRGSDTGLRARIGNVSVDGPQAVLVSNGPYATGDLAGLGRRARLDAGLLGVVTVTVASTRQAVGLLRRAHDRGLVRLTATEVVVDADRAEIPAGVDGESLRLETPVRCAISPGALRVRVPRTRPGTRVPPPTLNWARLRELAGPRKFR